MKSVESSDDLPPLLDGFHISVNYGGDFAIASSSRYMRSQAMSLSKDYSRNGSSDRC